MRIQDQQIEVFARDQREAFVQRMVVHLRDDFRRERQARGIRDADLELFVQRGMEKAAKYRVMYEDDVQLYLECMCMLGPDFDCDPQFPWAEEVLKTTYYDGETKMDELREYLIFALEWPLV